MSVFFTYESPDDVQRPTRFMSGERSYQQGFGPRYYIEIEHTKIEREYTASNDDGPRYADVAIMLDQKQAKQLWDDLGAFLDRCVWLSRK